MDGTVRDILGYPLFSLINDARSPAAAFAMALIGAIANAAAGAGIPVRSTSSSRSEFAMAPISAAVAAMEAGLLNMIENPNTPKKLIISLRIRCSTGVRFKSSKSIGCSRRSSAIIHANIVATMTIIIA